VSAMKPITPRTVPKYGVGCVVNPKGRSGEVKKKTDFLAIRKIDFLSVIEKDERVGAIATNEYRTRG